MTTSTNQRSVGSKGGRPATHVRARLANLAERFGILGVWVLVIIVFGMLRPDTFLTLQNFQLMLGSQAVLVVATLGLMIPLIAGDFDLTVASNLTLSAMIVVLLNTTQDVPILLAIAIALAAAIVVGIINGLLIVNLGMNSLIATLGMGTILNGVVWWISGGQTYSGVSRGLVQAAFLTRPLGVPMGFYFGLLLCITLWYVQQYTSLGRRLLYVGRGRSVSRLSGLRVARIRRGALVSSAIVGSLAGIIYAGTQGGADPVSGTSFLLPTFAAAFLGATCIYVGRFNALGTFVAVYFLVTGITGLQLMGAPNFVQQLFYGGALVIAVGLTQFRRRGELGEAGAI